jgi:probable selenium-dependent hydroxylase accessory protein YqeC
MVLNLIQALRLPVSGGTVSIVGAGGKTTLMLSLARELAQDGKRVVVSTTTHIMTPAADDTDIVLTDGREDTLLRALKSHQIVCAACPGPGGKLSVPPVPILRTAAREADWLIVEADGAHRKPVKAPAYHEPQIFEPSCMVIAVAGLTALGRPLREACHRFELACGLLSVPVEEELTTELLARLITSERGQFKNVGSAGRFRVLLNQADSEGLAVLGEETASYILRLLPGCTVTVAALERQSVKGVYVCSS